MQFIVRLTNLRRICLDTPLSKSLHSNFLIPLRNLECLTLKYVRDYDLFSFSLNFPNLHMFDLFGDNENHAILLSQIITLSNLRVLKTSLQLDKYLVERIFPRLRKLHFYCALNLYPIRQKFPHAKVTRLDPLVIHN